MGFPCSSRTCRPAAGLAAIVFVVLSAWGAIPAFAVPPVTGKLQGRIVSAETGEPIGFADVALVPADSTGHPVGGLTNADGTYLLEAPAGRYALRIRALSYASKRVDGLVIEAGRLQMFSASLPSQAIVQKEIVVDAKRRSNTETAMLAERKRAVAVGDAISAEQVRKAPDKDAAEVLRRVTGLSISDGKFVFVRGLGERYSSTDIDGVRIVSPEQNKRVVPLDLLPANLLENVVVQKTYTADRPGEFGGGDVQVHTRDFPGKRSWSFSISQGYEPGVTFHGQQTYDATRADIFGFGSDSRKIPDAVHDIAGDRKVVYSYDDRGFPYATLAKIGKSFRDVWSPYSAAAIPNASYSASYGDELVLFGHPLGVIESWSLSRSHDHRDEMQRLFESTRQTPFVDYQVSRYIESVQLGGITGLSYRLSPRHSIHLRGLYTNSADDEVRLYQGVDDDQGQALQLRSTRLMYVQRNVMSGTVEGRHEFPYTLGTQLDWKFTRSRAARDQPDRREVGYIHVVDPDAGLDEWRTYSGSRQFGDLRDNGWGGTVQTSTPYRLGPLGAGKLVLGYNHELKKRLNHYRRFVVHPNARADRSAPPDSVFAPSGFDGNPGTAYIDEQTLTDKFFTDNYRASQRLTAGFVSLDVPMGRHVRSTLGVRQETGFQDVQSFNLFTGELVQEGKLDHKDWLPSANMTVSVTDAINVRAAMSRTVSRPDLNELSPSPALEYSGGGIVLGNPTLDRARIDNYDVRIETFPSASEVLAAGWFYKKLHNPIEQTIRGAGSIYLTPENSGQGRDSGVELELRSSLGRVTPLLKHVSLNSNASFISSRVQNHPLQGQADYLVNVALSYAAAGGTEVTMLTSTTGKRLESLGLGTLPNVFSQPFTSVDATLGFGLRGTRVKCSAKNLLDPRIQSQQAGRVTSEYRNGRTYSVAVTYGS